MCRGEVGCVLSPGRRGGCEGAGRGGSSPCQRPRLGEEEKEEAKGFGANQFLPKVRSKFSAVGEGFGLRA